MSKGLSKNKPLLLGPTVIVVKDPDGYVYHAAGTVDAPATDYYILQKIELAAFKVQSITTPRRAGDGRFYYLVTIKGGYRFGRPRPLPTKDEIARFEKTSANLRKGKKNITVNPEAFEKWQAYVSFMQGAGLSTSDLLIDLIERAYKPLP